MFSALLSFLSANVLLFILHIDGSSSFPKPLSAKEERAVLERLQDGDPAARATLIERNLRLVSHIVKKYYSRTNDTEDLVSIGTIGLIKAIDSFDPSKGTYVVGINNLDEKDCGSASGWMYKVNGTAPMTSCGKYKMDSGDNLVFYYVCTGADR